MMGPGAHWFAGYNDTPYLLIAAIARVRNRNDKIGMALRCCREGIEGESAALGASPQDF